MTQNPWVWSFEDLSGGIAALEQLNQLCLLIAGEKNGLEKETLYQMSYLLQVTLKIGKLALGEDKDPNPGKAMAELLYLALSKYGIHVYFKKVGVSQVKTPTIEVNKAVLPVFLPNATVEFARVQLGQLVPIFEQFQTLFGAVSPNSYRAGQMEVAQAADGIELVLRSATMIIRTVAQGEDPIQYKGYIASKVRLGVYNYGVNIEE